MDMLSHTHGETSGHVILNLSCFHKLINDSDKMVLSSLKATYRPFILLEHNMSFTFFCLLKKDMLFPFLNILDYDIKYLHELKKLCRKTIHHLDF